MADINISINDDHLQRVIDAFCEVFNYEYNSLPDETRGQFTRRMVIQHIKRITLDHEKEVAVQAVIDEVNEVDVE